MNLIIPEEVENNALLAYETGLHIGDGNISYIPYKYQYNIRYCFSLKEDFLFVDEAFMPLFEELYHCKPNKFHLKDNTLLISVYSKKLFEFKTKILGLPIGKKKEITIPKIFLKTESLMVNALAGIFDSDGCIKFIKEKHNYPQVRFTNISQKLMQQIKEILNQLEISSTLYKRPDNVYVLDVNGVKNLKRFVEICSFKNHNHLTKLRIWKKYGFCQPNLSISKRINILGS